ncbi:MAG: sugar phosphate isomerase/epimerase [Prevotellaceae bacterium]|jgi:sugar phosphate isomerase/epimerase|nr:sugar phosphate isomerase/epimerase [Prevotellaceae bacterium]
MKIYIFKKILPVLCALLLLLMPAVLWFCHGAPDGWKLGVQAYTFHKFSYVETLDKLQTLGLRHVEIFFGQRLGDGFGDQVMDFRMDEATCTALLAASAAKNVSISACGVVVCEDEAAWEALFRFARFMRIGLITCEPRHEHITLVEQLAEQYAIDVAIHNHPQPSGYWHPDSLMSLIEGRSSRIGVCADVGHWKREGIDPVEALKKVSGRLKSLHFKDIKAAEAGVAEQHDVIWGRGVCDVTGMLKVLRANRFDGLMSIEYEYNWEHSVPDIRQCLEAVR